MIVLLILRLFSLYSAWPESDGSIVLRASNCCIATDMLWSIAHNEVAIRCIKSMIHVRDTINLVLFKLF